MADERTRIARLTPLAGFLFESFPGEYKWEGESLHPVDNHSISIKKGYCGYSDFETGEHGNSIDYLVGYHGFAFPEAVDALCDFSSSQNAADDGEVSVKDAPETEDSTTDPEFPEPVKGSYRRVFAYLMRRGIPADIIQTLIDKKLLYQSADYGNCVFINKGRTWAELRGTNTYADYPFHQVAKGCRPDDYWAFTSDKTSKTCYVCEGAIDAISLYVLLGLSGKNNKAYFASIGGVWKQRAINKLKERFDNVIIAVDNDDAGQKCRDRNPDCRYLVPKNKDWNEDLQAGQHIKATV